MGYAADKKVSWYMYKNLLSKMLEPAEDKNNVSSLQAMITSDIDFISALCYGQNVVKKQRTDGIPGGNYTEQTLFVIA